MIFHHSITVTFEDPRGSHHLGAWRDWLFDQQRPDPRVTRLAGCQDLEIPFEELISWLQWRKGQGGEPILGIGIPLEGYLAGYDNAVSLCHQHFGIITSVLGPELLQLELYLPSTTNWEYVWSHIIARLDRTFPHLRELTILPAGALPRSLPICGDHPLRGLPQLRKLTFYHKPYPGHGIPIDHVALARHISGLGSANCIYHNVATTTNKAAAEGKGPGSHPAGED